MSRLQGLQKDISNLEESIAGINSDIDDLAALIKSKKEEKRNSFGYEGAKYDRESLQVEISDLYTSKNNNIHALKQTEKQLRAKQKSLNNCESQRFKIQKQVQQQLSAVRTDFGRASQADRTGRRLGLQTDSIRKTLQEGEADLTGILGQLINAHVEPILVDEEIDDLTDQPTNTEEPSVSKQVIQLNSSFKTSLSNSRTKLSPFQAIQRPHPVSTDSRREHIANAPLNEETKVIVLPQGSSLSALKPSPLPTAAVKYPADRIRAEGFFQSRALTDQEVKALLSGTLPRWICSEIVRIDFKPTSAPRSLDSTRKDLDVGLVLGEHLDTDVIELYDALNSITYADSGEYDRDMTTWALFHEVGHLTSQKLTGAAAADWLMLMLQFPDHGRSAPGFSRINKYMGQYKQWRWNAREFFPEVFACYYLDRESLRLSNPVLYDYMNKHFFA